MKNVVVFDIDGCLMDNSKRLPFYTAGRFDEYMRAWHLDTPIEQGVVICRSFLKSPKYRVLFCTSRSESQRSSTMEQIQRHVGREDIVIKPSQVLMRPDNTRDDSYTGPTQGMRIVPDTELKPLLLKKAGIPSTDIFFVYEDRKKIVDMWRAMGVMVLQPADGDF